MIDDDFLYHYTSIQTLALILKNKKFKFNNLLYVDDLDEAETADMGLFGRHCLVSCWTSVCDDIIPMWNMYSSDMRGVRIKMRKNPFKEYIYSLNELHFISETKSCINYYSAYTKMVSIAPDCPLLIEVDYTDNEDDLKPSVVSRSENGINIYLEKLGKYKRKYWSFQQECRYKICTAPWTMEELENIKTVEEQVELFNNRILDKNTDRYCNEIYLDLADDAFENMEILLGPKATEGDKILVESLVKNYCSGFQVNIERSKLRIK